MKERTSTIDSKYLNLHRESEHFDYFFDKSFVGKEKAFDDIKNILEKTYVRLKDFFEVDYNLYFLVLIYPSIKSLHEECYGGDDVYWATAGGNGEHVSIIDPTIKNEYKTYERMINDLPHELVHSFTLRDIPCDMPVEDSFLPNWFIEGLANYLTEPDLGKDIIIKSIKDDKIPSICKLDGVTGADFGYNYGYQFSISIIELIVKLFGKKKILEIIERYKEDTYKVLGISKMELEKQWHKYLKEKYKNELEEK